MGSRVFAWLRALALVGVVLLMAATSAGALQNIGASIASQASSVNYGARLKQGFTVDIAAAQGDNEDNESDDEDNSGSDADNEDNSGSDEDNEDNSGSDDGDNKDDDSATDPDIIIDNVAPPGS